MIELVPAVAVTVTGVADALTGARATCHVPSSATVASTGVAPPAAVVTTETDWPTVPKPQIWALAGACCSTIWSPWVLENRKLAAADAAAAAVEVRRQCSASAIMGSIAARTAAAPLAATTPPPASL